MDYITQISFINPVIGDLKDVAEHNLPGPLQPWFDKTWKLKDFELLE